MFLLNLKYSIKIANKLRDLQYKMFLLNQDIIEIADMAEQNLQYKMFLLNRNQNTTEIGRLLFTIQNVPIKSWESLTLTFMSMVFTIQNVPIK